MRIPKITEERKKQLNLIRKVVPLLFLAIYVGTWFSYMYAMRDIIAGDVLIDPERVLNTSQLSIYVSALWLAGGIWISYLLIKAIFWPDGFAVYRLARIEKKIAELELQLPRGMLDERNFEDSDGRPNAGKGIESEGFPEEDGKQILEE